MSAHLFVHICLHVTYTNNILGNERFTTLLEHTSVCIICLSMKKDGAHQCLKHVNVHETRYSLVGDNQLFSRPGRQFIIFTSGPDYIFCTNDRGHAQRLRCGLVTFHECREVGSKCKVYVVTEMLDRHSRLGMRKM